MDKTYRAPVMTKAEYELRGWRIDPTHRGGEADLTHSRWFDYFMLHPVQATYLYAHLYKEQTRKFCESFIDIRTADSAQAFFPDDIFMSRDMTAMWLARRAADGLGIPYGFVLQFAQQRAIDRLYQCFPRPNQLYGEAFEMDLAASWKETLSRKLTYSKGKHFRAESYVGSALQKRHTAFLLDQIRARSGSHANLLGRMFMEGVLSPKMVGEAFPESVVEQANQVAVTLASQS